MILPKPDGNPRPIDFHCGHCDKDFIIQVPFGCYIDIRSGVSIEIMLERPGLADNPISGIWCPTCGCVSGLTLIAPKVEPKPDGTN